MAMRTIKLFDTPGGRFTLEEAIEAVRALQQKSAKNTAAKRTPTRKKSRAEKKPE